MIEKIRGWELVNFAIFHGFYIMNPFFEKKNQRRWTWRSPNYKTFNEIDYIIADKHQIVKNGEVMNQVNIGSDHRIVRCRVQMDTQRALAKEPRSPPKKP